jgi:hypothetical protein
MSPARVLRAGVTLLAGTIALPAASFGRAELPALPAPPVATEPCLASETSAIEQALAIELRRKLSASSTIAVAAPHFVLACDGDFILIRVFAADGIRAMSRTLDVSSTPLPARNRLTAIAAAELAASLWTFAPPPYVAAAPAPVASVSAAPTPLPSPLALRFAAFGDVRTFTNDSGTPAVGGGIGLAVQRQAPWGLAVDAVADQMSRDLSLGRATVLLLSARPMVTLGFQLAVVSVTVGAGARVGTARVSGQTQATDVRASTWWGFWGGPTVAAMADTNITKRISAAIQAELGWSLNEIVARESGMRALFIGGPWIAAQVGVGLTR